MRSREISGPEVRDNHAEIEGLNRKLNMFERSIEEKDHAAFLSGGYY
jgi:hypothetical protein